MRILSDARQSRDRGFTLIELLVVLAIIGILASIVVPNVARYLAKAQRTKAVAEIKNIDTALAGMLSNTGRSSFRDFWKPEVRQKFDTLSVDLDNIYQIQRLYNIMFYELLRRGREATFEDPERNVFNQLLDTEDILHPEIRQKLGTSYIDIGLDSWGNQYNFWMGPLRRGDMLLRSYRIIDGEDPNDIENFVPYVYNTNQRSLAQEKLPGQPAADELPGFPAPKDLPVYIWSSGANLESDAHLLQQDDRGVREEFPEFLGGGDDENNWDNAGGWEDAPK